MTDVCRLALVTKGRKEEQIVKKTDKEDKQEAEEREGERRCSRTSGCVTLKSLHFKGVYIFKCGNILHAMCIILYIFSKNST